MNTLDDSRSPSRVVAKPVNVVYIAGSGRSGTTLVDSVLGQQPGVWSAGEARYLWERGALADRLCGCGVPFSECAVWQGIMTRVGSTINPTEMMASEHATTRIRSLPLLYWRSRRSRSIAAGALQKLPIAYRAMRDQTNATAIVDSSKLPNYAAIIDDDDAVNVAVVHVVRDPRATAYSWGRTKVLRDYGDERQMQQLPPWKAAVLWLVWHATTEALWGKQALRVRYEDFVAAPAEQTSQIARFAGLSFDPDKFRPGPEVFLEPTHSVAGNPSRHRTGWIPVREDDEWLSAMSRWHYLLVTTITFPLLRRYRYPLRRGAHR